MVPTRRILHADIDAAFVACARLADPDGAGRASLLLVGGRPESRGVVTSASYEARAFGVRAGMPMAEAIRRCPQALIVPVPSEVIHEKSRAVRAAISEWAPIVEPLSIDECAMDLRGTEHLYAGPLADTAVRIREAVAARTGMLVSIGGGTNKLVAKLAVELAKPHPGATGAGGHAGVHIVAAGAEAAFLATRALADIPGVGPRLQAELRRCGMVRVTDALRLERRSLQAWLGNTIGAWLYDAARGIDDRPVEPAAALKSVSREETFAVDLHDDEALHRELVALVLRVTAELRADGLRARCVTVKLRDHDFRTRQASHTVAEAIETDRAVLHVAKPLLDRLWHQRNEGVRLLGVRLSGLELACGPPQLSLFGGRTDSDLGSASDLESARDRALARLMDAINQRHGDGAITRGPAL